MSVVTTNFGPRVSFTTTLADPGPIHVMVPSTGTFTAAGTNVLSGAVTAGSTLAVTGAATLSSTLSVAGAVTHDSTLRQVGAATLVSTATIAGAVTMDSTLRTVGAATFVAGASVAGALTSTSTFDQTALTSKFLSKQTTASYTSLTLADGELSIGSVSVTSATIYFRSGATTYEFDAQAATIL